MGRLMRRVPVTLRHALIRWIAGDDIPMCCNVTIEDGYLKDTVKNLLSDRIEYVGDYYIQQPIARWLRKMYGENWAEEIARIDRECEERIARSLAMARGDGHPVGHKVGEL